MAYFMKEHNCFPKKFNLQETMDLYFQVGTVEAAIFLCFDDCSID